MQNTYRPSFLRKLSVETWWIYLVLALVFIIAAYPFFYVFSLSVMPYEEYIRRAVHVGPAGFTTTYFVEILKDTRLTNGFMVSLYKTTVGTILNVVVTTMAGYALSRPLKFRKTINFLFLVPMFFSGGIIPFFLVIRALGILNTFWALVLPGLVTSFQFFMARAYFLDYPVEIIEAAKMDGANHFQVFLRIIWPTSTPIIATLALLSGTAHWNDYFWPSMLVPPDLQPATVILQSIISNRSMLQGLGLGTQLTPQSFIAAVAVILIVPILVLYPLLQRYVVKGIMIGSIKG